jgi:uncharacterized repeat protein (TIGR01451 family)
MITGTTSVFKQIGDSREEIDPNETAAYPGDTLEYIIEYTNNGDEAASGVSFMSEIPDRTELILESVWGDNCNYHFSVDDGENWSELPIFTEKIVNGKTVQTEATPKEFTHVKWIYTENLEPDKSLKIGYNVIIKSTEVE